MGYGTPSFVFMDFFKQRRGNSFEDSEEITAKAEEAMVSKGARCEIKQRMVTPFSSLAPRLAADMNSKSAIRIKRGRIADLQRRSKTCD